MQPVERRQMYPFAAIVRQERLKLALTLNAINSSILGVLIRGEKGTAKSTIVRALAELLPEIEVVKDCPYRCHPRAVSQMCDSCRTRQARGEELPRATRRVRVVELPLGATEDKVVGGMDFEHAIRTGGRQVEPGLLGKANRGIIYVDEVNLLADHLVDLLLDTAESGVNFIEREGISFAHPARFILVGTMNPEEGELRPQFLDRFGLCVKVVGSQDPLDRLEILKRRERYEEEPETFIWQWQGEQEQMRREILRAQELLPQVKVPSHLANFMAQLSRDHRSAGHRADIIMDRAARTLAAYEGRTRVTEEDVIRVAELVLAHRSRLFLTGTEDEDGAPGGLRQGKKRKENEDDKARITDGPADPGDPGPFGKEKFTKTNVYTTQKSRPPSCDQDVQKFQKSQVEDPSEDEPDQPFNDASLQQVALSPSQVGETFQVRPMVVQKDRLYRKGGGRRSMTKTATRMGHYVRSTPQRRNNDLAFDATIRAAAPKQVRRLKNGVAIAIDQEDIREKVRERRMGNLLVFAVDASGSMGDLLMKTAKGAIMSLLEDAYQKRDKVALVAFRETSAEVLLPPTNSTEMVKKLLEELPTGGKTPLAHGLLAGYDLIRNHLRKDDNISPLMILISDCRPNVGMLHGRVASNYYEATGFGKIRREIFRIAEGIRTEGRIHSLVIDVTERMNMNYMGRDIAEAMGAQYFRVHDLKSRGIVRLIKQAIRA